MKRLLRAQARRVDMLRQQLMEVELALVGSSRLGAQSSDALAVDANTSAVSAVAATALR